MENIEFEILEIRQENRENKHPHLSLEELDVFEETHPSDLF
jgi:hypothetical protein